jgi:predicted CopG family antitoxin
MTKSISLSQEAYTLLNSIKGKDETFSDVIRRLTGSKGQLMEMVALYPELNEVSKYEQSVNELRKQIDEALST